MCGPTAAGKSPTADALAEGLSGAVGARVTTISVDSMQVYEEIPVVTNQARGRPAELVGIVPVSEEWTVARHKAAAEARIRNLPDGEPFVLDAGTGMYLNALVLDVPLSPRVPEEVRSEAQRMALVSGAGNPRREARRLELELSGAPGRGSIWDGDLRYDAAFVYLRPRRDLLDADIAARSSRIAREGAGEAQRLLEPAMEPNPSVRQAIGVKEMLEHASGVFSIQDAEEAIATRTRQLARRQMRWFDKLVRKLRDREPEGPDRFLIVEAPGDEVKIKHFMHDRMGL